MAPMVRFSIFGIPVTIQPFFWAAMGILGFLFNETRPNQMLVYVLLFMLAGFVSILVHELGHALTGKAFGAYTEIVLHGFGGFAVFPEARFTRPQSFLLTLAGPALQALVGFGVLLLAKRFGYGPNEFSKSLITSFGVISIFWALINLIPVIPLDGGQIMVSLLGPQRMRLALMLSIAVAVVAAALLFLKLNSLMMPIFLASFAWQNYQMLKQNDYR